MESRTQTEGSAMTPTPSPGASVFAHTGTLSADVAGGGRVRAQHKPLKQWKSGKCYRNVKKNYLIVLGFIVWFMCERGTSVWH